MVSRLLPSSRLYSGNLVGVAGVAIRGLRLLGLGSILLWVGWLDDRSFVTFFFSCFNSLRGVVDERIQ
jgi:hypothetical protein